MHGSILDAPRTFIIRRSRTAAKLLACALCTGFWTGLACGVLFFSFKEIEAVYLISLPLASAATSLLFDSLLAFLERN